jgi:hypothetical protein
MKGVPVLATLASVLLAGCQPAYISVAKWDSTVSGGDAQTRCEQVDLRNKSEMDELFPKYDGWRLVYLSEYTTRNKLGTDAAVCFGRSK